MATSAHYPTITSTPHGSNMPQPSSCLALLRRSLRAKFIGVIVMVQIIPMVLVTVVIEQRQRDTILQESRKRSFSLASNLAALSEGDLLSYNFIRLEQTVVQIAAEADVAYALVQLHDGRVAAASGWSVLQGTVLDDPVSQQALKTATPLVQEVTTPYLRGRGYDVAIPFFAPGSPRKWGTIRVGFSLAQARREMRKTTRNLLLLDGIAILLGTGVAVFLAQRISKPVQQLVQSVNEVAQGHYQHTVTVTSQDEIGYLAQRFEEMRKALWHSITSLAEEKRSLEEANALIKATQEQLIQSEKLTAVGQMAAKIAHEVNNPLAIIKTSLDLLNKQLPSGDDSKENLAMIEEEIRRIARIMRQLLDFSRPASELSLLQVNEVIQHLMKFTAGDRSARRIESRLELADDLPLLRMSLDQLKQVLLNLIKNAQEAMPHGGTLHITTARQHGGLVISIADTGMGIPPEHRALLFEPFFTTKRYGEGMGLGLSVSANIIKSYGGTIDVDSAPGKGTVFQIFMPEHPHSHSARRPPEC
jgi:signal transduction histidine kinase